MFSCLVSIHSKMWIQQQISCLHQRLVSLAWLRCKGLICSTNIRLSVLGRGWRAVELSHRLHSPHPKPHAGQLIPQLDGCELKNHCRLRDHAYFFLFLVFRYQTRKLSADLRHCLFFFLIIYLLNIIQHNITVPLPRPIFGLGRDRAA